MSGDIHKKDKGKTTIIPTTKLRYFYDSLSKLSLSTITQLYIVKDINRQDNPQKLISWYEESKNYFADKYSNINEPFLPKLDHRKKVSHNVEIVASTRDVISVFEHRNSKIDIDDSDYSFQYIQREVPTYRTTNAESEMGIRGKSGSGGIDFIGLNCKKSLPILGEIKVKGDQNAFYALIQLLTYLAELSTPNQIARINKHKLFKNNFDFSSEASFYLYILLVFEKMGEEKEKILNETMKLAGKLEKPQIQEIEKIVFLKMHPESKSITKINLS